MRAPNLGGTFGLGGCTAYRRRPGSTLADAICVGLGGSHRFYFLTLHLVAEIERVIQWPQSRPRPSSSEPIATISMTAALNFLVMLSGAVWRQAPHGAS